MLILNKKNFTQYLHLFRPIIIHLLIHKEVNADFLKNLLNKHDKKIISENHRIFIHSIKKSLKISGMLEREFNMTSMEIICLSKYDKTKIAFFLLMFFYEKQYFSFEELSEKFQTLFLKSTNRKYISQSWKRIFVEVSNDFPLLFENYLIEANKLQQDLMISKSSLQAKRIVHPKPSINKVEDNILSIPTSTETKNESDYNLEELKSDAIQSIYGENVYHNILELNLALKEKGIESKADDEVYKFYYIKNQILLNLVARNEVFTTSSELYNEIIANHKEISRFGFVRIYDIKNKSSIFKYLSKDYPDFIQSKDIEEKDYFEIITEYKQGTATRKYLDNFIPEISKQMQEHGLHQGEINLIIDNALKNWELPFNNVALTAPDMDYFTDSKDVVSRFNKSDFIFVPQNVWFCNKITFDIERDEKTFKSEHLVEVTKKFLRTSADDISLLIKKLRANDTTDDFKLSWLNIFGINISEYNNSIQTALNYLIPIIKMNQENSYSIFNKYYNSFASFDAHLTKQSEWIFEYNKMILESKKNTITESFKNYISTSL